MDRHLEGSAVQPAGGRRAAAEPLTGQFFNVNSGTTDIQVPSQYAKLRFWRNTAVASLTAGQSTTLAPGIGTLGYEWDVDVDNGFRPAGTDRHVVDDQQRRRSSPTTAAPRS